MAKPIADPRPIKGLTQALRITLCVALPLIALTALGYGLHGGAAARLPGDVYLTSYDEFPGSEPGYLLMGFAGVVQFLVVLVAGFMALKWTYRANVNAHAMSRGVETSPSWSIWWWFIPLLSFFKPFAVMSEIWRSAMQPDRWKGMKDPAILRWWWGFHLVSTLVLTASSIMDRAAETAAHVVLTDMTSMGGLVVQIVSTVLYIRIIGRIGAAQTLLIEQGRRRPVDAGAPGWAP